MRVLLFPAALLPLSACGKGAEPAAATPVSAAGPAATPVSQWGGTGELLGRPAIESAAIDVAGRLGYHAAAVQEAAFDPSTEGWTVTVTCGDRGHVMTSLLLTLDGRTALVRRHRAATAGKPDGCAAR